MAGAGAFGRNHLRVLRELETERAGVALVAAVDPDAARADEAARQYDIPVFASVDALLKADLKLDAACVAVPTVKHYEVARELLDKGLDLLIEKPLAATLAEADALIQNQKNIVQPGHLERFNPAVIAVEPGLTRPMFFEAHRLSVFSARALDVDVVLDLMIHDLDIVLTFAKSPVREVRAVGLPILSPKVDIANVRVEFESGCVANFTASRVSTERVRKLRFFEPRQYVSIDYARRDVLVIKIDDKAAAGPNPQLAQAAAQFLATGKLDASVIQAIVASGQVPAGLMMKVLAAKSDPEKLKEIARELAGPRAETGNDSSGGPAPGLSFVKPEVTPGEPLRLEILSFLESVRT
ncbi:MAG: Gfo/Idh/MocA family oxidoreductase, partial [Terracidiphilus sp.]|nr:Gfo/Idh/MocA family oxidoreductase [Terracidiphilus sp.]